MSEDQQPQAFAPDVLPKPNVWRSPMNRAKLLQLLSEGLTPRQAAIELHIPYSYVASHMMPLLREKLALDLEEHGLSNVTIIERYLKPALEANKTVFATKDGVITDERSVPNWSARNTALDILLHMKGSYPNERGERDEDDSNREINVNIQVIGSVADVKAT